MNKIKAFLIDNRNIEKDSYIWNMSGSLLMAFQSVIMLMLLTRTLGLNDAGIFTIAYANANLFLTIGKYGMRNFQVSDVNHKYDFCEYRFSRMISSIAMLAISCIYVFYIGEQNEYSAEKSIVIVCMCLFKIVDSVEDVYHGFYQQKGRLDIAGKALTLRMCITIIGFGITLIVLHSLLISLIITTVLTTIVFITLTKWCNYVFPETYVICYKIRKIGQLMVDCFPLFLGSFLAFYIGNAPKYAIDSFLNDELQACYGFIAMPVFVIGLLNNFIFNPMIFHMSQLWVTRQLKKFFRKIIIQIMIIVAITISCVLGAHIIGIPVLSFLYNTNLGNYKAELIVLLLGGGFLALSGLLVTIITIIRFQSSVSIGYLIVAVLAYYLSPLFVKEYSIMGASILYLALMILLCFIFIIILIIGTLKSFHDFKK